MHEAAFSLSLKVDGDILTIRGGDIEEFEKNLYDLTTSQVPILVGEVATLANRK